MKSYVNIGSRREVFWDETMLDTEKTTTVFRLHEPIQRECVLTFEQPGAAYLCVLQDGDLYRMYTVLGGNIAYAESFDGIHWEQPSLGIVEINGSTNNSMLFDMKALSAAGFDDHFDGFRVFIDDNPECIPEERYKAVADSKVKLYAFVSPDGIHFKNIGVLKGIVGSLDSVNTVFYNKQTATYQAFTRHFHPQSVPNEPWIRDIRFSESKEFFLNNGKCWITPQQLQYDGTTDWQMYINSIMKYYRADHVYIGFPARYVQRREWTENYDELCGRDKREERFKSSEPRRGLAITDTLFMTSRDGLHWKRYPEAFLRPGPEHPQNWVYGSVYFSNGIVETKSYHDGCNNEISFYCMENRWSGKPAQVYRYTIRMDGFVSQFAPYPEANLVTKPFVFKGSELYINFSTSAYGYMNFKLTDMEGKSICSCETFGDSTDRRVRFDGDIAEFSGKPVIMSVNMCDADFYSFVFR